MSTTFLNSATIQLDVDPHSVQLISERDGDRQGKSLPLEIQVLIIESNGTRLVLVGADLLWFDSALADELRDRIGELLKIEPESVCLAATHTHGAPQTDPAMHSGQRNAPFRSLVREKTIACVVSALGAPRLSVEARWAQASTRTSISVNRRRRALDPTVFPPRFRMQNLPNERHPIDDRLTTITLTDQSGQPKAIVVHFACHPVADPRGTFGADFPGYLRAGLRREFGAIPVIFLQGYCGDVRPRLIARPRYPGDFVRQLLVGARFRAAAPGDSLAIGEALAAQIRELIPGSNPLPMNPVKARRRIPLHGASGALTGRTLDMTMWRVNPSFGLFFASGEMLSGLHHDDGLLSIGYANGMVGYLAPVEALVEGGYEVDGFLKPFGLSERFAGQAIHDYHRIRQGLAGASAVT